MSETSVRAYDIKTEMAMRCFILSVEVINTLMNLRVVMVRWPFVARTSFVVHGGYPARAVQAKSSTIPVVMVEVSDAVARGIVTNLAHAGGNITGLTSITPELAGKRLELLKEMIPGLKHVAVMWTPNAPTSA